MDLPILITENLHKSFGKTVAVENLSFELPKNKIIGLLGANGAGKSTTMQMILGLIKPTSGSISIFGMDMEHNRIDILRRVNFSSAYANLPNNLTVVQNLNIFAHLYGVNKPKQKIEELLETFEIADLRKRVTGHLSSGESTRLNLCKAFINDPELLLLDEPTASLDPDIADKVRTLINRIKKERELSILYTSHNMKDIETICDEIIFLQKGRIIAQGSFEEIQTQFSQSTLEEVFIKIARDGEITREEQDAQ